MVTEFVRFMLRPIRRTILLSECNLHCVPRSTGFERATFTGSRKHIHSYWNRQI